MIQIAIAAVGRVESLLDYNRGGSRSATTVSSRIESCYFSVRADMSSLVY